MKFSILQNDLLEGLQTISGVVPTRSATPILENILFILEGNQLKMTGTDLEVSITTEVPVNNVEKTGSIALPSKVVTEMIRSLPNITIHFEADENHRVKITTDQGLYQVAGISMENFPQLPQVTGDHSIEVDNDLLGRMFSKTIFAVSSEELRPALMGVYMQIIRDELRMVATDGHRLSKILKKNINMKDQSVNMIIPPKAVQTAIKNIENEGHTTIAYDETGLSFSFGQTTLYTRLVEGDYPDYERVIPRDNKKVLTVDKKLLLSSVKRVSLFSSALTHQIRFSLSSGQLVVCSEDVDIGGEAREELSVEYSEDAMEIGYNAQYLMDVLKHVDSEEVNFYLNSPVRATLVMPTSSEEDEDFLMLIMPIKLSS